LKALISYSSTAPSTSSVVKKIISENLGIGLEYVVDEANLVNDLGADDLNIIEIVLHLESEFSLTIPDEEIEKLLTVKNFTDYISHHLKDVTVTGPSPSSPSTPPYTGGGGSGGNTGGGTGEGGVPTTGGNNGGGGGNMGGGNSGGESSFSWGSPTDEDLEITSETESNNNGIKYENRYYKWTFHRAYGEGFWLRSYEKGQLKKINGQPWKFNSFKHLGADPVGVVLGREIEIVMLDTDISYTDSNARVKLLYKIHRIGTGFGTALPHYSSDFTKTKIFLPSDGE